MLNSSFRTLFSLLRLFSQGTSHYSMLVLEIRKKSTDVRVEFCIDVCYLYQTCWNVSGPRRQLYTSFLAKLLYNCLKGRWKNLLSQEKRIKIDITNLFICLHWPLSCNLCSSLDSSLQLSLYILLSIYSSRILERKGQMMCSEISHR